MEGKNNAIRITKGSQTWISTIKNLENRINLAKTSDPCDMIEVGISKRVEGQGMDGVPEFTEEFESKEIAYQSKIGQSNKVASDSIQLARTLAVEKSDLEKQVEELKAQLEAAQKEKGKKESK